MNEIINSFEEKHMSVNSIDVDFVVYYFLTKSSSVAIEKVDSLLSEIRKLPFANITFGTDELYEHRGGVLDKVKVWRRKIITYGELSVLVEKKVNFNLFFKFQQPNNPNALYIDIETCFTFSEDGYCIINLDFEEKITWNPDFIPVFDQLSEFLFGKFTCLYGFKYVAFGMGEHTPGIFDYMLEKMRSNAGLKFDKVFRNPGVKSD